MHTILYLLYYTILYLLYLLTYAQCSMPTAQCPLPNAIWSCACSYALIMLNALSIICHTLMCPYAHMLICPYLMEISHGSISCLIPHLSYLMEISHISYPLEVSNVSYLMEISHILCPYSYLKYDTVQRSAEEAVAFK